MVWVLYIGLATGCSVAQNPKGFLERGWVAERTRFARATLDTIAEYQTSANPNTIAP